ncbi:MAG: periplasmic copper-binding protein [Candidatus Bathyarchaeota archaeon B26-1]|nr:MAG: periplasmic copper-binding protein [Candidatus Bathyarchaeota archaeon B26-1]
MESYNNIAENNIIKDSNRGIQLSSVGNIVRNNYISTCYWTAIHCRDAPKDALIVGNILLNRDDVIYFNGGEENITITGNLIAGGHDGIEFEGESTNIVITYNEIRHNGKAIYVKTGVKNMVVQYNNIRDNGYGIDNLSNATEHQIDARYNWWGSPDGPGDMVSSNVLYEPWATTPWPTTFSIPEITVTTTVTETTTETTTVTETTTEVTTETTTTTTTETKEVLGGAFYGSVGVIIILIIALAYVLMRK